MDVDLSNELHQQGCCGTGNTSTPGWLSIDERVDFRKWPWPTQTSTWPEPGSFFPTELLSGTSSDDFVSLLWEENTQFTALIVGHRSLGHRSNAVVNLVIAAMCQKRVHEEDGGERLLQQHTSWLSVGKALMSQITLSTTCLSVPLSVTESRQVRRQDPETNRNRFVVVSCHISKCLFGQILTQLWCYPNIFVSLFFFLKIQINAVGSQIILHSLPLFWDGGRNLRMESQPLKT